ncbi:MAG: toll/interleukin-1 receptor domain-containing protein [Chthoniobacterales bacterium]
MRDSIFVSYSHADHAALAELQTVLDRFGPELKVDFWSDDRIVPAARWRDEIDQALSTAATAVLLLSSAFFASKFIGESELPAVLEAARAGELQILAVVLDHCAHEAITDTFQAINDPARPMTVLNPAERQSVWQRLASSLKEAASQIDDETRIGAESLRLERDANAVSTIMALNDKMARARVDPAFNEQESMRENTLVFLEGQLCQALATWLIEQSKRNDLTPFRSKAIVRMLEEVARREERALQRAKELTQQFADQAMAMLNEAREKKAPDQIS